MYLWPCKEAASSWNGESWRILLSQWWVKLSLYMYLRELPKTLLDLYKETSSHQPNQLTLPLTSYSTYSEKICKFAYDQRLLFQQHFPSRQDESN